jgi:hypothetical protein
MRLLPEDLHVPLLPLPQILLLLHQYSGSSSAMAFLASLERQVLP